MQGGEKITLRGDHTKKSEVSTCRQFINLSKKKSKKKSKPTTSEHHMCGHASLPLFPSPYSPTPLIPLTFESPVLIWCVIRLRFVLTLFLLNIVIPALMFFKDFEPCGEVPNVFPALLNGPYWCAWLFVIDADISVFEHKKEAKKKRGKTQKRKIQRRNYRGVVFPLLYPTNGLRKYFCI